MEVLFAVAASVSPVAFGVAAWELRTLRGRFDAHEAQCREDRRRVYDKIAENGEAIARVEGKIAG